MLVLFVVPLGPVRDERQAPGERLVRDDAQRVDVGLRPGSRRHRRRVRRVAAAEAVGKYTRTLAKLYTLVGKTSSRAYAALERVEELVALRTAQLVAKVPKRAPARRALTSANRPRARSSTSTGSPNTAAARSAPASDSSTGSSSIVGKSRTPPGSSTAAEPSATRTSVIGSPPSISRRGWPTAAANACAG